MLDDNNVQSTHSDSMSQMSDADLFAQAMEQPADGLSRSVRPGQIVRGTVVKVDREGVLVDIGYKSEGFIRPDELSLTNENPEDVVKEGQEIDCCVLRMHGDEGQILLSKRKADFDVAWKRLDELQQANATIEGEVKQHVKGGLIVDVEGVRGFVPASQVGTARGRVSDSALDSMVGKTVPLKVLEIDRMKRKAVFSNRQAEEEQREARRKEVMTNIAEGVELDGVVRRIVEFGAFIDLGGVDGLLHKSEISWKRVNHPGEVLKEGDTVRVVILRMNSDSNRISLGMKQLMSDPWKDAEHAYYVGQKIHGHVVRFAPFGVIVELEGDIEATIHTSELADKKVKHPSEVVNIGDDIEAIVTNVNANDRRMNLSLRQLKKQIEEKQEHEVVATYAAKAGEAGASTIGERMAQLRIDAAAAEAEAEAEEAAEAAEPVEVVAEAEVAEPAEAVAEAEVAEPAEAVEAPEEPKEA